MSSHSLDTALSTDRGYDDGTTGHPLNAWRRLTIYHFARERLV